MATFITAAGRGEIPTEATVADAALEDHYGRVDRIAQRMADAEFRAERVALHGHPFVVQRAVAGHVPHKANILPLRPCPRIINKILILLFFLDRMFQRDLTAFHLAQADHVGLAQQDEDLNRFGHIRRFAVGLRDRRCRRGDSDKRREGEHRERDE